MCLTEYNEAKTMNQFKEEGRAEGRTQEREKNALAMLRDKVSYALVSKYTELTVEEVKQLAIKNGLAQ